MGQLYSVIASGSEVQDTAEAFSSTVELPVSTLNTEVEVFKTTSQKGIEKGLRNRFDLKDIITVDATRPEFQLGSLYDRRTDNLLPSCVLWKEDSLNEKRFYGEKISSSQQWLTDSENTFSSKIRKLDIETGLTLSLLGEMVDIKGHAKYFEDTVSSSNVAKVSITYKETTVYQELTSDAVYDIDYKDLLTGVEKEVAFTHVVVGIQYGELTTMVFERDVKETESKREIEGALSTALKAIPISVDGNLNLNDDEKGKVDNIRCTIYSDLISNTRIENWDEALALFKSFPRILSKSGDFDKTRGVPLKIWLLPKGFLGSQHQTVVKEISSNFVSETKEIIESLTWVINKLNDLLNKTKKYSILNEKVARFLRAVENYKFAFHKNILSPLVLSVRNGSEDEDILSNSVQKHRSSPFAYLAVRLEKIKKEVDTFLFIEKKLSDAGVSIVSEDFLQSNMKKTISVALTLKVSKRKDEFINEMENYNLAQTETLAGVEDVVKEKLWFEDDSLKEEILEKVYRMRDIAFANQTNEDAGFFMRVVECEKMSECYAEVWENGKRQSLHSFEILSEVQNLRVGKCSHDSMEIKWDVTQGGRSNISTCKIEVRCLSDGDEIQILESSSEARISLSSEDIMQYEVINLRPANTYKISLQYLWLNDKVVSKPVEIFQMTRFSNPPVNFEAEVVEKRLVKLSWDNPTVLAKDAICKSFLIEYKTSTENIWQERLVQADLQTYIFSDLSYTTEYKFRILARYEKGEETLPTEEIYLKTESMEVIQIKKASFKNGNLILRWKDTSGENPVFILLYRHENDEIDHTVDLNSECKNDKSFEYRIEYAIPNVKPGRYICQMQSKCYFGVSEMSDEISVWNEEDEDDFPSCDIDDEDESNAPNTDSIINESDVIWAIQRHGIILERNKTKLAPDKKLAVHRLLQSITRMDYQCLNRPIQWQGDSGKHLGYCHPMDLMHFVIKNLDVPPRSKLYKKLSLCKLAVPVLFPGKDQLYMDMSLRQVKIAWGKGGQTVEGNVTNAPVILISMMRCGQQCVESISKSKLANDLFKFKSDPDFGSCGFFSKYSSSSNKSREVAKGTVEGMWYEAKSNGDKFPASFGLLNLRGDALEHIQTASTVASASDVLVMFCGKDMFKTDSYKNLLQTITRKLSVKERKEKMIQNLVVVFTKDLHESVKINRSLFKEISKVVNWEFASNKYQKLLSSINNIVQSSLRDTRMSTISTLNVRFGKENKESNMANTGVSKDVNDFLLKTMDMIKNADVAQRSALRESLFPLQSTTKDYAETQRKENRSLDIHKKTKLADDLIAMRQSRFEKIKSGLPKIMSAFLRELFNARSVKLKAMFVHNVQYCIDDWCCKYLFDVRMRYLESVRQLTSLKEREIKHKKMKQDDEAMKNELTKSIKAGTVQCASLSKCLLDMSVGIENIFREIGEIYETTKRKDACLIGELAMCIRELPELAAALLMKGFSIELLDGDGLSVPTLWLEEVMKALEKSFRNMFSLKTSPKIFVLTVLGTQSTGKSTLLNTMFGVQFPVSAGRCTKGAFMQLIPILIEDFPYKGLLIIDTEGLGAPEYKEDNTHDNEIATFVLGISDLAIINVRGELPTNIENFLQVSTCALMRMSMVDFHPSVVFVHQNCDPSSKEKNLTGRHSFMKVMDEVVSTQAKLIQKQDRFSCFQDVVDISLNDQKNDFVYFPQLFEGAPPMSPPSGNYSEACSNLTSYILDKMQGNFDRFNNAQTLQEFAEKIKLVWNGVLEENFVLSLINSAEIQVKYDINNQMSKWKVKMESYMEGVLEKFSKEVAADFKAKKPTANLLRIKQEQLQIESHAVNSEQKKNFIDHIEEQTLNQKIFKNWEQRCINKMDKVREYVLENCQKRLRHYYKHEANDAKWRDELQKSKNELHDKAKLIANNLLLKKESDGAPEFTDQEIEDEFEKFWSSKKNRFISNKEKTFVPDNVRRKFVYEIGSKYGKVNKFKSILDRFGSNLENKFKIEWIQTSDVEFIRSFIHRKLKQYLTTENIDFSQNMEDLIANVEHRLLHEVIYLHNSKGLIRMKFQHDSSIFDCGMLVRKYLVKAINILIETHDESGQKDVYNLTDTFKVMFLFFAAQTAIPNFEKAQQSFIDYMDISNKLDSERENIKQLFTLILKKAGALTIAANQITKILRDAIKDTAAKQIRILCKDILLRLVTQKVHVHGLVLHDVIAMLEDDLTEENINYLKEYFRKPFRVFKKKILHVLEECPDIRLNDMMKVKFDIAVRKISDLLEKELQLSNEKPLIEVICKCQYIKSLGIGEIDFDGIQMPEFKCQNLTSNSDDLGKHDKQQIEREVQKRMEDESDIINKVKALITETDQVHIDIPLNHQEEIKAGVISDVNCHLFECLKTCPLCRSPCNETHPGGVGPDSNHSSRCHRPKGFAGYLRHESDEFSISFCNDSIKYGGQFRNSETRYQWVEYKHYRTVNSYYDSWNIEGVASEDSLYWKYITYQVTKNLNRFFPDAEIPDVFQWKGISKSEAIRTINSLFHLDGNTIARNIDGFHYIKASEIHA